MIQAKKEYNVTSIGLVVLNNCSSHLLAKEISMAGVYVIGIKDSVKDKLAIEFSSYLYSSINLIKKLDSSTIMDVMRETVSSMPKDSQSNIMLYFNGEEIDLQK